MKWVNDSPVYVVRAEGKRGPEKTLHRDLLLPRKKKTLIKKKRKTKLFTRRGDFSQTLLIFSIFDGEPGSFDD